MGEGEWSEGVPSGAHHEPSCAEKDRRSAARPVGQGAGTAKEGSLVRRHSQQKKEGGDLMILSLFVRVT